MPKIYTKTGDKGNTGTFYGRISKSDQLARALGAVDELNSWVGLCRSYISPSLIPPLTSQDASRRIDLRGGKRAKRGGGDIDAELKHIQKNLLTIGSALSGSGLKITAAETRNLEKLIDKLTKDLPKLANFIYPKGELQLARSVARRAEREVVALEIKDKNILKYLNRLSDALFTMGRWVNAKQGKEEEVWKV